MDGRAIAPDMIGFGRSDKPTRRTDYSVRAHTAWLSELIALLRLERLTLVVQDWGGPVGLGALAARAVSASPGVVAANTVLHTAGGRPWPGALGLGLSHHQSDGDRWRWSRPCSTING